MLVDETRMKHLDWYYLTNDKMLATSEVSIMENRAHSKQQRRFDESMTDPGHNFVGIPTVDGQGCLFSTDRKTMTNIFLIRSILFIAIGSSPT